MPHTALGFSRLTCSFSSLYIIFIVVLVVIVDVVIVGFCCFLPCIHSLCLSHTLTHPYKQSGWWPAHLCCNLKMRVYKQNEHHHRDVVSQRPDRPTTHHNHGNSSNTTWTYAQCDCDATDDHDSVEDSKPFRIELVDRKRWMRLLHSNRCPSHIIIITLKTWCAIQSIVLLVRLAICVD